jgi:photosystem II stability/assembly factor-like uncharacterized protein
MPDGKGWVAHNDPATGGTVLSSTSDAGRHWTDAELPGVVRALALWSPDGRALYALVYDLGGGTSLMAQEAYREKFEHRAVPVDRVECAGFAMGSSAWVVGRRGERIVVALTADAGKTWRTIDAPVGSAESIQDAAVPSTETAWILASGGKGSKLMVTRDGGRTWIHDANIGVGITPSAIAFVDSRRGVVVGDKSRTQDLLITRDGGVSWQPQPIAGNGITDCRAHGQTVWCAAGTDVLQVTFAKSIPREGPSGR